MWHARAAGRELLPETNTGSWVYPETMDGWKTKGSKNLLLSFLGPKMPYFQGRTVSFREASFFRKFKIGRWLGFFEWNHPKKTPDGQWVGEHLNVKVLHVNSDYICNSNIFFKLPGHFVQPFCPDSFVFFVSEPREKPMTWALGSSPNLPHSLPSTLRGGSSVSCVLFRGSGWILSPKSKIHKWYTPED